MLKRFYADNFRCLTNFELKLDEANVLLGANGTGKTSVLSVLRKIQHMVARGRRIEEVFSARDLSLRQNDRRQRFAIECCVDNQTYGYRLTVEHDGGHGKMRIAEETLEHAGRPLYGFQYGEAQLYDDEYVAADRTYPFDWTLSGLSMLHERPNNRKITRFRNEIANYIVVNPCPPTFRPETKTEDDFLEPMMGNFVGWYRYRSQENMGAIAELFEVLRQALAGFHSIRLRESGENSRVLKAVFRDLANNSVDYGLDQLSDGQRALIVLYSLIVLTDDRRVSLFIDEPDNYLALREVQPWLAEAVARCGESLEQIVVVSHHPTTIDYMAGAHGRWFFREGDGPVRVMDEPKPAGGGLSISETIARGWQE